MSYRHMIDDITPGSSELQKIGKHKSQSQKNVFSNFTGKNPDLAKNFVKGNRVAVEALWADVAKMLTSEGPQRTDVNGWKKVWSDWKGCIRKKIAHNKCESRATGRGQFNKFSLTPSEEEVAQICGIYTAVEGIAISSSFGVNVNSVDVASDSLDAILSCTDEIASGGPKSTPLKRRHEDTVQDCLKKHTATEAGAVEKISDTLQFLFANMDKLTKLVAQQNELIAEQNQDRRKYYLDKQESLINKNVIKQKMLEIEEIRVQRDIYFKPNTKNIE
ncbi:uncharacterized protein LOC126765893 [Bactrocera neohumeralis]|uniref:uncharacterized protein LOC126765893 n=1 Tax=Bactrocera neohumeralis TaxID=98809 RepID=UPI002166403B|nr:uncharacterized protein LOC126765893 [Bactrocera neohumeralis]